MDSTIQVNNREECKIGCLGPQRGPLPWAAEQITNDGRSFALPISVEKNCFERFL